MSTIALGESEAVGVGGGSVAMAARNVDLLLVVVALPVFVIAGLPIAGYLVAVAAWLTGRALKLAADRRSARSLAEGDRQAALRPQAIATLGRVWLLTGAVLIVGLIDRDAGLAGAVLAAALFTAHLLGLFVSHSLGPEGEA